MDAGGVPQNQIATTVWANPTRTLTRSAGAILGFPALSVTPVGPTSLTAVATTSILTRTTTSGIVAVVGAVTNTGIGTGSVTSFLDIIVDGNTLTIPLYTVQGFDTNAAAVANLINGGGGAGGNSINFALLLGYNSSITVQLRVTASTLSAGTTTITVLDAHNP